NEVKGIGNHLSFGDYGYDPRLGRRWNVDPLTHEMASWSPYSSFFNNPIKFIDADGRKPGDPPTGGDKPKVKIVQKSEISASIGPQAGLGGSAFGVDLTIVNFNIFKITVTETIDLKTGESNSDFSFKFFTGDVETSVAAKTPVGSVKVANKFKIDSDAEYVKGTQKYEASYTSPSTSVQAVPVKGSVTYTKNPTGDTSVKAAAKTSASLKFILGLDYSSEAGAEAVTK
nr:hypothetical protein [Bacteroidota bacterium]